MKIKGSTFLVTGAGSGIGRGLCVRLAREGASGMTLVEVSRAAADETLRLVKAEGCTAAVVVVADVADGASLEAAFATHVQRFGTLHGCFNNAGVEERRDWRSVVDINMSAVVHGTQLAVKAMTSTASASPPSSSPSSSSSSTTTAIVNVASAGGIFPMPKAPVYSATKAAVVLYSRSLAHLARTKGVRVNALCPQFTDTALVSRQLSTVGEAGARRLLAETGGGLLTVHQVVDAAMELLRDDSKAGEALAVMNARGGVASYVPIPDPRRWKPIPGLLSSSSSGDGSSSSSSSSSLSFPAPAPLPAAFRRVVVHTLSANFSAATKIVSAPVPTPAEGEVLIERRWTGVNASDINFTSGRYFGGVKAATAQLPFDAGFESVGVVAAVGPGVEVEGKGGLRPGQPVATTTYGGFSEYATAPWKMCVPVPEATPQVLALLTSGLTASLALEQSGNVPLPAVSPVGGGDVGAGAGAGAGASTGGGVGMKGVKRRMVVLVTAAAGGTGQIAVQLAKLAGHTVVATCGGEAKVEMLKRLGADRVINYRNEKVRDVLRTEFKKGVDLAYESVGGEMFAAAVDALAPVFVNAKTPCESLSRRSHIIDLRRPAPPLVCSCSCSLRRGGKIIVIGMMSQYKAGGDGAAEAWTPSDHKGLPEKLLWKSGTCVGFFLPHYAKHFRRHLTRLYALHKSGQLSVEIDPTTFHGLEAVPAAVEHLQGGKSIGKVVVKVKVGGDEGPHPGGARAKL